MIIITIIKVGASIKEAMERQSNAERVRRAEVKGVDSAHNTVLPLFYIFILPYYMDCQRMHLLWAIVSMNKAFILHMVCC